MIWYATIALCCLAGSAACSGFENGILAVRRARLDHAVQQGSRAARAIAWFRAHPGAMLGTVLLGNNLCNCLAATCYDAVVQGLSEGVTRQSAQLAVAVSLVSSAVLTIVVLVFGEITPKMYFRERPLERVSVVVLPMLAFHVVAWPVVKLLSWLSDGVNRLAAGPHHRPHSEVALMRDDFRMLLIESEEAGYLDREGRRLLDNSLDYHDVQVSGVMIPLGDVQTLPSKTTLREALKRAEASGVSRFPVIDEGTGRWTGVFSVYDAIYLKTSEAWETMKVGELLRPLIGIEESAGIHQVLPRSRLYRSPLLAVLNGRGEPVGIVTARDVIEPLFGELDS